MKHAALMIVIKDQKILGVSRGTGSNYWALPGGKAELDETPERNAVRETFEETGIKVTKASHVYGQMVIRENKNGYDFYSDCFFAEEWEGDIKPSHEGDVEWMTTLELTKTKAAFPEYNTICMEVFRNKFPHISIK